MNIFPLKYTHPDLRFSHSFRNHCMDEPHIKNSRMHGPPNISTSYVRLIACNCFYAVVVLGLLRLYVVLQIRNEPFNFICQI